MSSATQTAAGLRFRVKALGPACVLLLLSSAHALDVTTVVEGLERRYASVETVIGNFRQTYRAPGMDQVESGTFWLKKPGLMRWEYRSPEEKLFVADGRESFLYVPEDRQVTVQPLRASDLRSTPLDLFWGGDISRSFTASWEKEFSPQGERTCQIRLTPRRRETEYAFLVLELDSQTYDLRRILIREPSGNTSEFFFTNVTENARIKREAFQFKAPKGVEIIRLDHE
jgi:outer membrane lipoprotein carrier protein